MKKIFATAASVLVLGLAAPAMAQSSTSSVSQIGSYNGANIDQIGTDAINNSTVRQGLATPGSSGNGATVVQNAVVAANGRLTINVENQKKILETPNDLNFPQEMREKISFRNAEQLFGLKAGAGATRAAARA